MFGAIRGLLLFAATVFRICGLTEKYGVVNKLKTDVFHLILRGFVTVCMVVVLGSCTSTKSTQDAGVDANTTTGSINVVKYDQDTYEENWDAENAQPPKLTAAEKFRRFFSRENQREIPADGGYLCQA